MDPTLTVAPADALPSLSLAPGVLESGSGVRTWLEESNVVLQYLLVFVFAAIPFVEILAVIPIAVAVGLHPAPVALFAFAGNVAPIYAIVAGYDRLSAWLERRRDGEPSESKRRARARRLWNAYGMPGLALLAPVLTGVHLAAVLALGFGARARSTLAWMSVSIACWTVAITLASVAGLSLLEGALSVGVLTR
ncbi:small multi-drug export protein [Natronobiforma cellulositropha]|uniref:small multi-drug export protein n=1 Tax=Natronobiforma cellulositropha TaxID=1679076 RepID=UPI0021D610C0|nr:small multi-drug export protein [Natronobiforma cellulositropha]